MLALDTACNIDADNSCVGDDLQSANNFTYNDSIVNLNSRSVIGDLFKNISQCEYVSEGNSPAVSTTSSSLFIFHVNIRSLQKNFDNLLEFMNMLIVLPDIICLSETRLKSDPVLNVNIPGYTFIHKPSNTNAGGVAMYINNQLQFEILHDCQLALQNGCEDLWIKLSKSKFIIGVTYRHPNCPLNNFLDALDNTIYKIHKKNFYIVGDINLDLLPSKSKNCNAVDQYLDLLASHCAIPIITKPTRITESTATLIDHILTNDHTNKILPGVFVTHIADHYPVFAVIYNAVSKKSQSKFKPIFCRDLAKFDKNLFCNDLFTSMEIFLSSLNLNNITQNNFDAIFNSFIKLIQESIDQHAPLVKVSRKRKKLLAKPWLTKGILTSIKNRQKLYRTHFLSNTDEKIQFYKKYSNKLNKIKFLSKKLYFQNKLTSSPTNGSMTWSVINTLLSKVSNHNRTLDKIHVKDKKITDSKIIANEFNDYFCKIGSKLAERINCTSDKDSYRSYLKNHNPFSIFLNPSSPSEIINVISSLNNSKSTSNDNISTYFLKIGSSALCYPLSILFNKAFSIGIFPACLKTAKVIPVFKSGNKYDISNYRPISILSPISKILEKLIHYRIMSFLNKHNILISSQYGFRSKHSTEHALMDVVTQIYDNINNNEFTAVLFFDLKKAFDTVNHDILLQKLWHYGIRGSAHNLLSSFLAHRSQYVRINDVDSNTQNIICGVPQGSVLGPLLFILYVNDVFSVSNFVPKLFADDTCFVLNETCSNSLNSKLEKLICDFKLWTVANKFTLNITKSNLLIIPPKLNCNSKINNNIPINESKTAKYLGITIDNKLTFKSHILNLRQKLSRAVGIICKLKPYLSTSALLQLYYAIFHSHLHYGLLVWSSTYKTYLKKLSTLQNKAIKIIAGANWKESATKFYYKLKVLKLVDVRKLEIALFMYKFNRKILPCTFTDCFKETKTMYSNRTRSFNLNYFIPFFKSQRVQRSIKYCGAKIWNSINPKIKELSSLNSFKKGFKGSLVEQYKVL